MILSSIYIHKFPTRTISTYVEQKWFKCFQEHHIESPEVSIKGIKSYVLKNFKKSDVDQQFHFACKRRLKREPLQYIIKEWDFRYLTLVMQKPVFIPRPETECLVDLVNTDIKKCFPDEEYINILEVGCGSGAISLSLLNENKNVTCVAIDQLREAVDLTIENADRCNVSNRIKVLHVDINDASLDDLGGTRFDMLVSNPPYIPCGQLSTLQAEVRCYEDCKALDGGEDGLDMIRVIKTQARQLLQPNSSLWLEVDETHPQMIEEMLRTSDESIFFVSHHCDHFGRRRFCHLKVNQ